MALLEPHSGAFWQTRQALIETQVGRYGSAIAAVAIAVGVQLPVEPGRDLALAVFLAAAAVSTWMGGWRAGLVAMVLGYLAALLMGNFSASPQDLLYFLSGLLVIAAVEILRIGGARAEAARHSLNFALEAASMTAFDINLDTGRVEHAENAARFFGLGTVTGSRGQIAEHIHPEDRGLQIRALDAAIAKGKNYYCRFRFIRPEDQRVIWLEVHGDIVRDKAGHAKRVCGVVLDVTERVRMEETLQEQARDLSLASERKSQFIAVLAHELRTPLTPIRNAVALIRHPAAGEEARTAAVATIDRQAQSLDRLVEDLLDVSRIEQGKIRLQREPVPLSRIFAKAVEAAQPHFDRRRQKLSVHLPAEPLELNADELRLVQVLANLLNNASKFTPPGGSIELAARAENGFTSISVRDDGIGISPEHRKAVFEVFFQAREGVSQANPGLGIGLSLAKAIVELHAGEIGVHSEGIGKGSVFTVRLPLKARQAVSVP